MKRAVIMICIFLASCEYRIHTVEIEYCNGRIDTVEMGYRGDPCEVAIENRNRAVPEWNGYLNVCHVRNLKSRPL